MEDYRPGIDPLPAIHIRSSPPTTHRPLVWDNSTLDDNVAGPSSHHASTGSRRYIGPSTRAQEFHDWYTSSSKHGPEHLTRPPVFLPSKIAYDELGRSIGDGVSVEVDLGERATSAVDERKEKERGERVADWYRTLSGRSTRGSTPVPRGADLEPANQAGSSRARAYSHSPPILHTPGRLPEETVHQPPPVPAPLEAYPVKPSSPNQSSDSVSVQAAASSPSTPTLEPPTRTLRIHRREWFIRRALLRQTQAQATQLFEPLTPTQSTPTSISSLLNIPLQPKVAPAQYILGPENRGYVALRERGWEGGGLGRPRGWDGGSEASVSRPRLATDQKEDTDMRQGGGSVSGGADHPVDLTGDSGDESESVDSDRVDDFDDPASHNQDPIRRSADGRDDHDNLDELALPGPSGPGRTAPIPTTLKLDRLGLGHRRSKLRATGEVVKKVTHTAADMREAQRKAKMVHVRKGELGKKGKVKWKDKDKKEREERRRLAAALNA